MIPRLTLSLRPSGLAMDLWSKDFPFGTVKDLLSNSFGKAIGNHTFGWQVFDSDFFGKNPLPDKVITNVNVLGSSI